MGNKQNQNLKKIGDTWHFRIQWKGQTIKRTLGVCDRAAARVMRNKFLENLRKFGQLEEPVEIVKADITFGEVVKIWASIHKKEVKYSTWRDYRSAMNCYLLPKFKDRPIKEISYTEILEFRNSLAVSPKRANNIMVPMKSVFDMATIEKYIPINIMRQIKRLREEQPDIKPFSYIDIKKIVESIDPWYRNYVIMAFFTGMRDGEMNGLKWADYHPKMRNGPEIHIRRAYVYGKDGILKTKSSSRNIQCLPEVVKALDEQRPLTKHSEYVFLTKEGNRMNPDHFRHVAWKPALKKAEIEYRPAIQTRHTFATMMLSSGEDIGWVQNMLGHSSLQMIYQRYFSWIPKETRSDGKAFRKFVDEADLMEEQNQDDEAEEKRKKMILLC